MYCCYQHGLCIVDIVDLLLLHVVHYKKIRKYHILVMLLAIPSGMYTEGGTLGFPTCILAISLKETKLNINLLNCTTNIF